VFGVREKPITDNRTPVTDSCRFQLVAFDLYGTLLDIGGLAARMEPLVGETAPNLLARWRKEQLERSWDCNRTGRYEAWDRVTAFALKKAAPELPEATRRELESLWRTVPAYPDAGETLAEIRRKGARCAILSNGTHAMIESALGATGLEVDRILSADDIGVYKTDPRVYALLDGEAPREATLFVSSNGWDAEGARRNGRTVAWLDRGGERPGVEPDYRIQSLPEIASIL
jgi:2-haloacid dehalogenase